MGDCDKRSCSVGEPVSEVALVLEHLPLPDVPEVVIWPAGAFCFASVGPVLGEVTVRARHLEILGSVTMPLPQPIQPTR